MKYSYNWLIHFNGLQTRQGLFYAKGLGTSSPFWVGSYSSAGDSQIL